MTENKKTVKILTVVNEKGGVGKSALIWQLAHRLAEQGKRTLVVDLDAAGGQATLWQVDLENMGGEYIRGSQLFAPSLDGARPYAISPLISLIPADNKLLDVDGAGLSDDGQSFPPEARTFRQRLFEAGHNFEMILIDTPGVLQVRVVAALLSSTALFTPFMVEPQLVPSLNHLNVVIHNVRKLNPLLKYIGLVPNMIDCRSKRELDEVERLRQAFGSLVLPYAICRRAAVKNSMFDGKPVWSRKSKAAKVAADEAIQACNEILRRVDARQDVVVA